MMAEPNKRHERIIERSNNSDMYPSEIVTERPQDQLPFNGITIIWPVTSSDTEYTSESGSDIVG